MQIPQTSGSPSSPPSRGLVLQLFKPSLNMLLPRSPSSSCTSLVVMIKSVRKTYSQLNWPFVGLLVIQTLGLFVFSQNKWVYKQIIRHYRRGFIGTPTTTRLSAPISHSFRTIAQLHPKQQVWRTFANNNNIYRSLENFVFINDKDENVKDHTGGTRGFCTFPAGCGGSPRVLLRSRGVGVGGSVVFHLVFLYLPFPSRIKGLANGATETAAVDVWRDGERGEGWGECVCCLCACAITIISSITKYWIYTYIPSGTFVKSKNTCKYLFFPAPWHRPTNKTPPTLPRGLNEHFLISTTYGLAILLTIYPLF